SGVGLGDDLVDQIADFRERSRLQKRPVVWDRVGIEERELERLASPGFERTDLIAQVLVNLDRDGARALDLVAPGIRPGRMRERRHVGEDGMGGDRLRCGAITEKPREWGCQLVNGREEIERRIRAGPQMEMKLV